jgi:hypothetical protein
MKAYGRVVGVRTASKGRAPSYTWALYDCSGKVRRLLWPRTRDNRVRMMLTHSGLDPGTWRVSLAKQSVTFEPSTRTLVVDGGDSVMWRMPSQLHYVGIKPYSSTAACIGAGTQAQGLIVREVGPRQGSQWMTDSLSSGFWKIAEVRYARLCLARMAVEPIVSVFCPQRWHAEWMRDRLSWKKQENYTACWACHLLCVLAMQTRVFLPESGEWRADRWTTTPELDTTRKARAPRWHSASNHSIRAGIHDAGQDEVRCSFLLHHEAGAPRSRWAVCYKETYD